ncbi:MAG: transcription elongation factor [Gammaproteobacteria bacterium]|nr:transcription elongation factor [Gammaproteobacteria bacterium]
MNKILLHKKILTELKKLHQCAIDAAQRAYETAVDEENEAENKYDTMGLEASYLVQGQSQRVEECENDCSVFSRLQAVDFTPDMSINIGSLVQIEDADGKKQSLFLSPVAGGLKVLFEKQEITLITPLSPIGKLLTSSFVGDDIFITIVGDRKYYEIVSID